MTEIYVHKIKNSRIYSGEVHDIQVIKHKPIFSDEFFNNYIKGHNFDLYEVTTSYRQINELYEDHRDLV